MGYIAGADRSRWQAARQWRLGGSPLGRPRARRKRDFDFPDFRIHAVDPGTGESACGYDNTIRLSTSWEETPEWLRCAECVSRTETPA
jgi:hypothetical protein